MSTSSLSTKQLGQLRTVVDLCASPDAHGAAAWDVLETLQTLVGSEAVGLIGTDPIARSQYHSQEVVASGERWLEPPSEPPTVGEDHPFWHHYASCQPCSYPDRVGGRAVVAIRDFYGSAEWSAHPMRREVLCDLVDEVVLAVPHGGGRTVRLLFPRYSGRPFSDSEKFVLQLLLPHLEPFLQAAVDPPGLVHCTLTPRQQEILAAVRLGLSNKQIAFRLGLSPHTVRKHLENIFERLEVQSRGAAVHVGFRAGRPPHGEAGCRGAMTESVAITCSSPPARHWRSKRGAAGGW
jgi:DNA-binding CsgD family transcriptional regulator